MSEIHFVDTTLRDGQQSIVLVDRAYPLGCGKMSGGPDAPL